MQHRSWTLSQMYLSLSCLKPPKRLPVAITYPKDIVLSIVGNQLLMLSQSSDWCSSPSVDHGELLQKADQGLPR